MSNQWRGFDYIEDHEVTRGRTEWRAIIERAARVKRVGGDLCLFDANGEMTHEIYDRSVTD